MEDRTVYTLNNYAARHGKEKNLAGSKLNLKIAEKWAQEGKKDVLKQGRKGTRSAGEDNYYKIDVGAKLKRTKNDIIPE